MSSIQSNLTPVSTGVEQTNTDPNSLVTGDSNGGQQLLTTEDYDSAVEESTPSEGVEPAGEGETDPAQAARDALIQNLFVANVSNLAFLAGEKESMGVVEAQFARADHQDQPNMQFDPSTGRSWLSSDTISDPNSDDQNWLAGRDRSLSDLTQSFTNDSVGLAIDPAFQAQRVQGPDLAAY